jgi:hypothetical protein
MELRKSFRFVRRAERKPPRGEPAAGTTTPQDATAAAPGAAIAPLENLANALGERLQTSGTLHLPGDGATGIVLEAAVTPILETAAGRHLIIDQGLTIPAAAADALAGRWPGFSVIQPAAGTGLRGLVGRLLDAAGYESVLRSTPLTFGRGVTVRLSPDYVVLRTEQDLLAGETRAISIVDPTETCPAELRELAGEHQVRLVEMTPDGDAIGADRAPWRDASGHVTTVETPRLAPIIEEIAAAFGLNIERRVPLPAGPDESSLSADLRLSRGEEQALVFETPARLPRADALPGAAALIAVSSGADLPGAIGVLLKRFGIPAIGPTVEFYRRPLPGSARRFVISVPGWLAEVGGRRLLVTGAAPPPLVRLYLTREGIDILEYRSR